MDLLLTALGAFLLGSIPTGYLVARAKGVDIRRHGSGNIGATNVFRTLGKPLGILVFFIDALKGFSAVWLANHFGQACPWTGIVAAVAAIAGHNYTPWLGFKGGKGIATSAGVLLALMPWAVLIGAKIGAGRHGRLPSRRPEASRSTGPWWRTTWLSISRSALARANTGLEASPTGGSWAGSPTNTRRVR